MPKKILLLIFCLSVGHLVLAQDANYWSGNYGPGGFFTPGAVIANNRDSGVLFYNPALQALTQKKSASISGTIYQMESIKIKDGAGKDKNLHSRVTSSVPQMLSGTIAIRKKKPVYFSYALIHTSILNYNVSQRQDTRLNVLDDANSPGLEYYIGQYTFQNVTKQTSALISSGWRLSQHWAIGLTAEGQVRSQYYSENFNSRALVSNSTSTTMPLASNEGLYQVDYNHYGLKFRLGLSYENGKHHVGALFSSPLAHLGGNGTLFSDNAVANVHFIPGDPVNLLASTRQTHLKTNYKTPASFALGYAYDYGKGQLYIAGEYFLKIKEYNILTPRQEFFVRPDTGRADASTIALLKMKEARKAVFNIALGVSYQFKPQLMGYCAVRTDFNYAGNTDTDGFVPNTAIWDNYHCQLGVNLKRSKYNLRTGLLLGYGRTDNYQQPINFDNAHESNLLTGTPGKVAATHITAALMVAFVHNL